MFQSLPIYHPVCRILIKLKFPSTVLKRRVCNSSNFMTLESSLSLLITRPVFSKGPLHLATKQNGRGCRSALQPCAPTQPRDSDSKALSKCSASVTNDQQAWEMLAYKNGCVLWVRGKNNQVIPTTYLPCDFTVDLNHFLPQIH